MNKNKISKMKDRFIDLLPDVNVAILGLQGSRMLGLNMSGDADYDYRGVYIAKNEELLSLNEKPREQYEYCNSNDDEMDYVIYELGKFFRLSLKGNPSILHIFFTPIMNYCSDIGGYILANKNIFLGEKPIRKAFGGYAMSQILYLKRNHKLKSGLNNRKEKHIRHCFRSFDSGMELLETGSMTFPLKDPEKYIELSQIKDEEKLYKLFEEYDRKFNNTKSCLPEYPDSYTANKILLDIRLNR